MKSLSITLIFMAFLAGAAVPTAVNATSADGRLRSKDWQQVAADLSNTPLFIQVTRDIELVCQNQGGDGLPRFVTVLQGAYPIEGRMHPKKGGDDWLSVPAVSSRPVRFGYNNSAGRTWGYTHTIAINAKTLATFPREIVSYTQEWSRLDRSRWSEAIWSFGCVLRGDAATESGVIQFITQAQFQLARNGGVEESARDATDEERQRKRGLDLERPLKSQIGTQLCKEIGPLVLQGFMENRSPDNEKVQIRIWRASLSDRGRPSGVADRDFVASVVWDHPDHWSLCEQ